MNEQNPWIVQAPKNNQTGQVPVGFYTATFKGVEDYRLNDGSMKWRFTWEVKGGPENGKIASALTDRNISPTTLPGVLITGLLGHPIQAGDNVKAEVDACKGKVYFVNVQAGPKGGKPGVRSCGNPPSM